MELLAQDLQVTLEGNHILNGVILEAGAGELVGIIGPNGSGKSTLLKCLYRQLVPQGGAVYLNGRDLSRESRRESASGSFWPVPWPSRLHASSWTSPPTTWMCSTSSSSWSL